MARRSQWTLGLACVILAAAAWPAAAQQVSPSLYAGMRWRSIGPYRAGRSVAVAGVPGQPDTFYFGAVDGGVWKTIDDGMVWRPIFDHENVAAIGAVAVAPSDPNIVYVGTGEADARSQFSIGDGMFKSTDGGKTWARIGLRATRQIGRIIVDPHDPNRLFVAALGDLYAASPARGVYRSTNGGATWQKVLFTNANTGAIDLTFDPRNSQVIYAALWATRRPPWVVYPSSIEPGSGLYKSTDGGAHWTHLTRGLPTAHVGRIGVAVAPTDPNRLYAIVDAPEKQGGLYRSNNAGATWRLMDTDNRIWNRGWYFESVNVDPKNENIVYAMNTTVYRSTDGGRSFVGIKGAPGGDDYHQLWINPSGNGHMILGSDQGVIVSVDNARSWSSWNNQPTAQIYHITADNRNPFWIYGAQQDSGARSVISTPPGGGRITYADWGNACTGGESGDIVADPLRRAELYGSTVTKCNMVSGTSQNISPMLAYPGQNFRHTWTLPLAISSADQHALYFGNQFLFKTENGGSSWRKISPDLTRHDPGVPANLDSSTAGDTDYFERKYGPRWGVIYTIAPSPILPDEVWVGTDDGLIQMTRNGGRSWHNVTPPQLTPWSKVVMMVASHFDPQTAYAAVDRHRLDDNTPHIYRTTDGGKTWREIVSGIPHDEYLESITQDPTRRGMLFAGTTKSVYVSFNAGSTWQSLRLNMPPVEIRDFLIKRNTLVVATFGRSFWALDNIGSLRQMMPAMASAPAVLFRPPTAYRSAGGRGFFRGASLAAATDMDPTEVASGQPAPTGATVDYYLQSGTGPVSLDILNASGKVVRHFSSTSHPRLQNPRTMVVPAVWAQVPPVLSAAPGFHRWIWDLREIPPGAAMPPGRGGFGGRGGPGHAAIPAHYTVRLTADGHTYTQPLTVAMVPGVAASVAGLAAQVRMNDRITALQTRIAAARRETLQLRRRLAKLGPSAAGHATVLAAIASLDRKARAIQGYPAEPPNPDASGEGDAVPAPQSLAGLASILGGLSGAAQSGLSAPSPTVVAGFRKAAAMATAELASWAQIKTQDISALNQQLRRANLPSVAVPLPN
jgi:photosystem II stability/assembly factor-like uncharacterized protein